MKYYISQGFKEIYLNFYDTQFQPNYLIMMHLFPKKNHVEHCLREQKLSQRFNSIRINLSHMYPVGTNPCHSAVFKKFAIFSLFRRYILYMTCRRFDKKKDHAVLLNGMVTPLLCRLSFLKSRVLSVSFLLFWLHQRNKSFSLF